MFSSTFATLRTQRDELAWLDTHDYTACSLADQLRYCESLCALTEAVSKRRVCDPIPPGVSFVIPLLEGAAFSTSSPHFAIVYHGLLLATRMANEKALTSLRDAAQIALLRRVVGVFAWERNHGEHQRAAMRKHMPVVLANFDNMWRGMQIALHWAAQYDLVQGSVKPTQEAPGLLGINWPLESVLLSAHMARQAGQYSTSRKLYADAKRVHGWVAPKELQDKYLSSLAASHFQDHDPADTQPLTPLAAAASSSSSNLGTAPPSIFG